MSRIRVKPETLIRSSQQMTAASKDTQELLAQMASLTQQVDVIVAGDPNTAAVMERFAANMKQQVQLAVDVFAALGNKTHQASDMAVRTDKHSAVRLQQGVSANITGGTSPIPTVKR